MRRWQTVVLVGVAACALGSGAAWATIPDSSSTIHGCYKQNGGALRLIDTAAGQACLSSELPIAWNQVPKVAIRSETQLVPVGGEQTFTAHCLPGERATGGGYRTEEELTAAGLQRLTVGGDVPQFSGHPEPVDGDVPDGWKIVNVRNDSSEALHATVYAVCASPS